MPPISTRLSGEVRRGMAEKASRGGVVAAAPFGYRNEGGTRMGKPVRRFFCVQKDVVKRDALDRGTPKCSSPYRSGSRS